MNTQSSNHNCLYRISYQPHPQMDCQIQADVYADSPKQAARTLLERCETATIRDMFVRVNYTPMATIDM
jgi:hypothetical protein